MDRSKPRQPELTEKGKENARHYASRMEVITKHLIYEGVNIKNAREDALVWAMYSSEESMEAFYSSADIYQVKYELRDQRCFSGETLCKRLKDGIYSFPFLFYREHIQGNSNLSMANSGFYQPCNLHIEGGNGTVQLYIREVKEKSRVNGNLLSGHVRNLKYDQDGYDTKAEIIGSDNGSGSNNGTGSGSGTGTGNSNGNLNGGGSLSGGGNLNGGSTLGGNTLPGISLGGNSLSGGFTSGGFLSGSNGNSSLGGSSLGDSSLGGSSLGDSSLGGSSLTAGSTGNLLSGASSIHTGDLERFKGWLALLGISFMGFGVMLCERIGRRTMEKSKALEIKK